jgi:hypothetical protein
MVHHFTSSVMFMPFWTGSFLTAGQEERDPFPAPLILQIFSSGDSFKTTVYCEKCKT